MKAALLLLALPALAAPQAVGTGPMLREIARLGQIIQDQQGEINELKRQRDVLNLRRGECT